jgi:alkanesulfonate monooxygenase SsuD/methylene tetrahydromethanopterin reductase-like flavin-dependent oxidoreductase (luciferase family)
MRNIVLRFDMRTAGQCPEVPAARYRAAIEMAEWADGNTVDVVGLSEHHDTPDGFLSAPLQLAGMMIARTRRIRVSVSALLVPLHDPLRLAEDIALLDITAQGRFSATCGLGYRKEEYDSLGVDWERRGRVFDEKLDVLVPALKGERFEYHGRSLQLNPAPASPVQALLTIGGNSKAAARRAARLGLVFCPAIDDPELEATYHAACREHDTAFGLVINPREPATTFISRDPATCWKEIGDYLLYDALSYGSWRHPNRRAYAESFATNLAELQEEGKYRILTPEEAVQVIEEKGSLHLAPLTGGVPSEAGWKTLRLFENEVQPYIYK